MLPPLWTLFKLILEYMLAGLLGLAGYGFLFPIMLGVVLLIVHGQHSRQSRLEEQLFGASFSQPKRQTGLSLGYGLLGGLLASMLMVSLGIALSEFTGLQYVWPVVILLMLIQPRFMCFAYGGGIVGVANLLLRGLSVFSPSLAASPLTAGLMAVDLPSLMALVAILHLTESLLIYVSGHINASPIIIESPRGEAVGGFMLQRFWPLPLVALLALTAFPEDVTGDSVAMPGWWPLLRPILELGPDKVLFFALMPIVAALGYSDIAIAHSPKRKSQLSARNLLIYSLGLLALALLAGHWRFLQLLPVLFAPLGHEYLINYGNRREWASPPLLNNSGRGVTLLAVLPDSPAREAGLDTGWVVLNVNGYDVNSRRELGEALAVFPGLADLEVVDPKGHQLRLQLHQRGGRMGMIPVPDSDDRGGILRIQTHGYLARKWKQWRKNN